MRCSKSQILLQHATVRFHIWNHTVACCKFFCHFFIHARSHFFSLPFTLYLFPLSPPCSRPLSSMLKISQRITSPPTSTTLAADLHIPCCRPPIPCLSFLLSMSLYIFPLLPAQDLSPPHLAVNFQSPCRRPSDLLIKLWVWDLGWVLMCEFWVIDRSVGLELWGGGGIVVMAVVGWVLGWRCLWL